MVLSQEEIRKEMLISAREWALIPSGNSNFNYNNNNNNTNHNKKHFELFESAVKIAIASSQPAVGAHATSQGRILKVKSSSNLPNDLDDAVQKVLGEEIQDSGDQLFVDAEDRLGLSFKPFYQYIDKRSKQETYRRCRNFEGIKVDELDPLKRFVAVKMKAKDWYHKLWYGGGGSLLGTVYEAVVAHHMEHFVACRNCFRYKCLRWNGGWDVLSSWADVVCTNCHATYEIKSKASTEQIDKRFMYNSFNGGSFKTFYRYYPQSKRYLVVVSRSESFNTEWKAMSCRVSLAEIERIVPRFSDESFVDEGRILSEVRVKKGSLKLVWFHLPPYRGNFQQIAADVYMKKFGKDAWHRTNKDDVVDWDNLHHVDVDTRSERQVENEDKQQEQEQEQEQEQKHHGRQDVKSEEAGNDVNLSKIREKLDTLKLDIGDGDGGWEDLYDSD